MRYIIKIGRKHGYGGDQIKECVDDESDRNKPETRPTIHVMGSENGEISGVESNEGTAAGVAVLHEFSY